MTRKEQLHRTLWSRCPLEAAALLQPGITQEMCDGDKDDYYAACDVAFDLLDGPQEWRNAFAAHLVKLGVADTIAEEMVLVPTWNAEGTYEGAAA